VADIFREVDEDVRKDKATALWKKYGSYVVVACVALVIGTAGRVAWREYSESRQIEEAQKFSAATALVEQGETSAATAAFEALSRESGTGYAVVAAFREAEQRAKAGDRDTAVAIYDKLAGNGDAGPALQDLARVFAAMALIDEAPADEIRGRLAGLDADDSAFRFSVRELLAVLSFRDGDLEAAKTGFRALAEDAAAPSGVRARAQEMLAAMGEAP